MVWCLAFRRGHRYKTWSPVALVLQLSALSFQSQRLSSTGTGCLACFFLLRIFSRLLVVQLDFLHDYPQHSLYDPPLTSPHLTSINMRATVAIPVALAVAASAAPAMAVSSSSMPSSEAISWGTVGKDALKIGETVAPFFLRRDVPTSASEAINWKKVGSVAEDVAGIALKFLKRDPHAVVAYHLGRPVYARDVHDALLARAVPTDASEAINWNNVLTDAGDVASVAGTVLKFLRRDVPASASSEAINWKTVGEDALKVGETVAPFLLFRRELEDAMLARAYADDASEAINWKDIGKDVGDVASVAGTVLRFLRRQDADSEAISWSTVGKDALKVGETAASIAPLFFRRELENELLARAYAADSSEAINWKDVLGDVGDVASVAGTVLKFLKRSQLNQLD
ncbi:hypothetical protein WOLCODRAFT_164531 [Wolfiporia cocos MD-104 SS10]|uniref:Uncharacterized protein n=1 Tax=Wolfiporia cocos (strain MD-104) TaxID=742152 RepID=A0A2H3JPX1_WOLCO|nr:hypothetical protein WOLCODRAFT_164531 [Wolfiporia cocos MD-104 SS10]